MRVRVLSPQELNGIVNQPAILPYLHPNAISMDMGSAAQQNGWIILGCEGVEGACAFAPQPLDYYELHYLFASSKAPMAVKACIGWVFDRTPCQVIYGYTPREFLAARSLNRWLGGSAVKEHTDGAGRPCTIYELTREQWYEPRRKSLSLSIDKPVVQFS